MSKTTKAAEALQLEVIATRSITEENFNGQAKWTHARRGERGTVVDVAGLSEGTATVRFARTGTVTTVDLEPGGDAMLNARSVANAERRIALR